jgi:hypothetical protein
VQLGHSCGGAGLRETSGLAFPEVTDHPPPDDPHLLASRQNTWPRWPQPAPAGRMLGLDGHFLTKSRRYSITFTELRDARTDHVRRAARETDSVPEPDGETLVVINHWRYAGHGAPSTLLDPIRPPHIRRRITRRVPARRH